MDTLAIPTFLIVIFLLNELEMENVLIFQILTLAPSHTQIHKVVGL